MKQKLHSMEEIIPIPCQADVTQTDKYLAREWLLNLHEARIAIEDWQRYYIQYLRTA